MLKRINWKSVFKCFAWVFCLGGIVTLMSFVTIKKRTVNCTNIKILIPGADNFIEREEIDAILKQSEGQLIGRKLEGINLHAIEDKIKANPYIAVATIYADMDGVIHIEISQRQPLLRIINAGGQDFYIDRNGLKMPVSPNFTANVVVANGHILERYSGRVDTLLTRMGSDLYKTALFLKKDSLWSAQIEQIFVNDKDDIELIPRVGNQRIILGTADSLEVKMKNLYTFYKKAMPEVGWDTYKTINIKYTNQIVCEKTKPDSLHHGSSLGHAAAKPTVAGAKLVMDSIVKAEIASELKNNPGNEMENEMPEKKNSPPEAKIVHKPEVKVIHQPVAIKAVHHPDIKPAHKPVLKPEVKPWHKPVESKSAIKEEKTEKKIPEKKKKPPLEKRSALADDNKAVAPVVKKDKPLVKTEKKTAEKKTTVKTTKFPEIKWITPSPKKVVKPKDVKPKVVKSKEVKPKMVNLHDDN